MSVGGRGRSFLDPPRDNIDQIIVMIKQLSSAYIYPEKNVYMTICLVTQLQCQMVITLKLIGGCNEIFRFALTGETLT